MSRPLSRRHAAAILLILATVAFVLGINAEQSLAGEAREARPAESDNTRNLAESGEKDESAAGEADEAAEGGAEEIAAADDEASEENETILGVNPESTAAIAAAVAISLVLAAALWFWGSPWILVIVAVFASVFAILDLREVVEQLREMGVGIAAIALLVALLHGGVAVFAGLALAQRPSAAP